MLRLTIIGHVLMSWAVSFTFTAEGQQEHLRCEVPSRETGPSRLDETSPRPHGKAKCQDSVSLTDLFPQSHTPGYTLPSPPSRLDGRYSYLLAFLFQKKPRPT